MSIFGNDDSSSTFTPDLSVGVGGGPQGPQGNVDQELQDFLMLEKQKAQFNAQIHEFNDICWEKCITDKPGSKLDGRTETCLNNCVDRFIDVSLLITNRFAMTLQKNAKMLN